MFSLEDLRQSESISSFREDLSRVSSEWSYEKQRLKEVMEDKPEAIQGLFLTEVYSEFELRTTVRERMRTPDERFSSSLSEILGNL